MMTAMLTVERTLRARSTPWAVERRKIGVPRGAARQRRSAGARSGATDTGRSSTGAADPVMSRRPQPRPRRRQKTPGTSVAAWQNSPRGRTDAGWPSVAWQGHRRCEAGLLSCTRTKSRAVGRRRIDVRASGPAAVAGRGRDGGAGGANRAVRRSGRYAVFAQRSRWSWRRAGSGRSTGWSRSGTVSALSEPGVVAVPTVVFLHHVTEEVCRWPLPSPLLSATGILFSNTAPRAPPLLWPLAIVTLSESSRQRSWNCPGSGEPCQRRATRVSTGASRRRGRRRRPSARFCGRRPPPCRTKKIS